MQPITYDYIVGLIKTAADFLNGAFLYAMQFMRKSPFDSSTGVLDEAADAAKAFALVLVTLLFMIDFFGKTINIEWIKWENVLMLFMKLIVAKTLIENAPYLMEVIFDGFNSLLNIYYDDSSMRFFPTGQAAVDVFISTSDQASLATPNMWLDLRPFQTFMGIAPYIGILTVMAYFVQIIAVGRMFELLVYTIISPIPLACFASSATTDIGKSFLKNYVAVCLQAFIIVALFIAYPQVQSIVSSYFSSSMDKVMTMLPIIVLGGAIGKSGSWAKKMLGII